MLKGFRDFLFRGNIVDLAVAVVIGTAFTALVTAFGNSFIKPLVGLIGGGGVDGGKFKIHDQIFDWAAFINACITFAMTAVVVYFVVVVPMQTITARLRRKEEPSDVPPPEDIQLLTEIRDLLLAQQAGASAPRNRPDTAPPSTP
jgi:large conductance mechanosensitive channel